MSGLFSYEIIIIHSFVIIKKNRTTWKNEARVEQNRNKTFLYANFNSIKIGKRNEVEETSLYIWISSNFCYFMGTRLLSVLFSNANLNKN